MEHDDDDEACVIGGKRNGPPIHVMTDAEFEQPIAPTLNEFHYSSCVQNV